MGSRNLHPLPRPRKTTIKQLRLERDGYSNIIINWFSCVSGLHARLKILRIEFDSLGNHKQGDVPVVSIRIREDKKIKVTDGLLTPWTTKNE